MSCEVYHGHARVGCVVHGGQRLTAQWAVRSTTATQELVVLFTGGKDSPPHAVRSTTATQELIVNDVQGQTPIASVEVQRRLSRVPPAADLVRESLYTHWEYFLFYFPLAARRFPLD